MKSIKIILSVFLSIFFISCSNGVNKTHENLQVSSKNKISTFDRAEIVDRNNKIIATNLLELDSVTLKRYYPYKEIGSHIIGYVSRKNSNEAQDDKSISFNGYVGRAGLEKYYDEYLNDNKKLILNIDMELQEYISSLFNEKAGSVIVMNVNGAILSASSFPEYNLNALISGMPYDMWNRLSNSLEKPFINKLINGLYPPGSTSKPGLGLLYISTDIDVDASVNCTSFLPIGKRIFRCSNKNGHQETSIKKAIKENCDDYFYKGSLKVGIKTMSDGLHRYGFGKKTGIDLANEFKGVVPSRKWKKERYGKPWYIGETLNTSIGQGDFLVTPVQVAQNTALMATGKLPIPNIVKSIGDVPVKSQLKDVFNKKELSLLPIIQQAMYEAYNHSQSPVTKYLSPNIEIAGMAGMSQVLGIDKESKKRMNEKEVKYYSRSHSWFTSYGPFVKPQYVVTVFVEHADGTKETAGAIASKIYNKLLELNYIK